MLYLARLVTYQSTKQMRLGRTGERRVSLFPAPSKPKHPRISRYWSDMHCEKGMRLSDDQRWVPCKGVVAYLASRDTCNDDLLALKERGARSSGVSLYPKLVCTSLLFLPHARTVYRQFTCPFLFRAYGRIKRGCPFYYLYYCSENCKRSALYIYRPHTKQ